MSEVKFGVGSVPANQVAAVPAPAAQQAQPVTTTTGVGLSKGDFVPSMDNVILPHINLAHAVGKLGETFAPGTIIFDTRLPLYVPQKLDGHGAVTRAATPPLIVTILGWRSNPENPRDPTRFVQKLPGGARGMLCNTEAQVRAASGTTDWGEWNLKKASGMTKFDLMATAMVVIQRPDAVADDGKVFNFPVNDKNITLAWWNFKGSSYTKVCKGTLFYARKLGCLKAGFDRWSFSVTSFYQTYSGTTAAWIPVFAANKPSTPEMLAFAAEVMGNNSGLASQAAVAPEAEADATAEE